ncbi:MAG TPA: hypothetical protein PKN62_02325 [bacterium]|nr:hypothetical protein [bacterium]
MKIKSISTVFFTVLAATIPTISWAQKQIVPTEGYEYGDYDLTTAQNLIIFVGKAILGLSGTFAFVMFIWGGIQMILAAGKSDKYKQGMQTLVNALIGLAVIFCSYMIIKFVLDIAGADSTFLKQFIG